MQKGLFKKLVSLILAVLLCSSVMNAFAIIAPGPKEYELEKEYVVEKSNVTVSGETLSFSANGSIKFDLLMPFDSDKLVLTYDRPSSSGQLTIETDKNTYTVSIPRFSTSAEVAIEEKFGSNTIKFTSTKALKLKGINFIKIDEKFNEHNSTIIDLTEYEDAVINSVIVKDGATYLKSKGPMRRWSFEDIYLAPQNIEGRLYVPLKPFAEALGYYCEDYPDKAYVYIQGEFLSIGLINGKGYIEKDTEEKREVSLNIFYQDDLTWVPVRAFAELLGLYIEYREGYVVIDDRLAAKRAIENENVFSAMKDEFAPYTPKKKTEGKTYHVAQTANSSDANSGTEKYPFKTLAQAALVAEAGDTVIIHEGTYRETLAPKNDGTVYAPITFKAAEGENVTISALEKLTGFEKYKNNIYVATYEEDLGFGWNQLFYKGEALVEGRHPNEDTHPEYTKYPVDLPKVWPVKGNIRITTEWGGSTAYSPSDLNQLTKDYWKGGTFVAMKGEGWTMVSGEIVGSEYGQISVAEHEGTKGFNLGTKPWQEGSVPYYRLCYESDYGYITNHINTLDVPGEWYAKDHRMYVIPPQGADLNKDFEIKQRQLCMDLRDRKYVTVKGINTLGGSTTMAGDSNEGCVLDGGSHKYISHFTQIIDASGTAITPEEGKYSMTGLKAGVGGIALAGQMNTVINTNIDFSAGWGIVMIDKFHYVSNNLVTNTAYAGGYVGGIHVRTDVTPGAEEDLNGGHYITNNTIYNTGRAGLGMLGNDKTKGFYPMELAYNHVYQGSITARDTGVFYEYGGTYGTDKRRTQFHHNYIHDIVQRDDDCAYMRYIIYHDGLCVNQDTYNNITFSSFIDSGGHGTFVQNSQYTVIRDRSNSDLGLFPGGVDSLEVNNYPKGRPFFAGSYLDGSERFMDNYEIVTTNAEPYFADNHVVDTAAKKEIYRFNDVDIVKDEYTEFSLFMKRGETAPKGFYITVNAYDKSGNLVETHKYENSFQDARFYIENVFKGFALLPPMEAGKYDIEFVFDGDYTEVLNMRTSKAADTYKLMFRDDMIFGGSWDDYTPGEGPGERMALKSSQSYEADRIEKGTWWTAGDCWDHTIYYRDRKVTGGDTLRLFQSSGAPYDGSKVTLYINSLESEPIATFTTENTGWYSKERLVKLDRPLEDGTYTFIWKFEGESKCSTLYCFNFVDSSAN